MFFQLFIYNNSVNMGGLLPRGGSPKVNCVILDGNSSAIINGSLTSNPSSLPIVLSIDVQSIVGVSGNVYSYSTGGESIIDDSPSGTTVSYFVDGYIDVDYFETT